MRFTWKALAEIAEKHGDNPNLFKPEIVADIAAAGLRDKHPEYTAERIMDLSPPLVVFAKDVQEAIQWAYFGAEAIPEDDGSVKKNRLRAGLWQRIKTLWNMVFHRSNSGI
jgi:hypothetical protein